MKLNKVAKLLDAKVLSKNYDGDTEVFAAWSCDLMSDVLAFVDDQALLLTGLINPQVVRTASMMDMKAIIFVRGKVPGDDIIELAEECDICILSTDKPMYISSGILYSEGLHK